MSTRDVSFVQPASPVFWVFVLLGLYGIIQVVPLLVADLLAYPAPGLVAAVLWTAYAAVLGLILYRVELFERRSWKTIVGALFWGGIIVTGIGVTASPAMADLVDWMLGPENTGWTSAIAAPLVEEPLKMLGVIALALIPGAHIRTTLDGLFYGLMVGLGFEVIESYLYTVNAVADGGGDISQVVPVFFLRGFLGGLWSHPTFTGITGAAVGYFISARRPLSRRMLVVASALLVAMFLHGLFNSPLLQGLGIAGGVIKGLPALVVLLVVFRLARRAEQERFDHVVSDSIDRQLISETERATLLDPRSRRRARRELGSQDGRRLKRLQRAQIDLVDAVIDGGVDSERSKKAARYVRELKS